MNKTRRSSSSISLLVIVGALSSVGCNVCEDLDNRICTDLGADDCSVWKESGSTFTDRATQGGGRRSFMKSIIFGKGASTCQSAGNDAVYPQMLEAARAQVAAQRAAGN